MYTPEYEALVACATRISDQWRELDRDYEAFPAVVLELTKDLDLSYFGQLQNLHRLGADPRVAELQRPSTFSDLYFKLYDDGHYWVEVLNWWASDVNTHDHDFSGVQFQLTGKSLNVTVKFRADEAVEGVELGHFEVAQATVWEPGTTSIVVAGDGEPHQVCHLNLPTVSLLFRTHPMPELGPQNNYFAPFMRGSYKIATIAVRTRLKMLRMLARSDQEIFEERFWQSVREQTVQANLFTIVKLGDLLYTEKYAHLLAGFAGSGIAGAEMITQAVGHYRATDYLKALMKDRVGPDGLDGLSIATLASGWDGASLGAIQEQLASQGWATDVDQSLVRAFEDGSIRRQGDINRILRRFGRQLTR